MNGRTASVWLALGLSLAGCADRKASPPERAPTGLAAALQRLLDSSLAANPQVPSLILAVDAPVIGLSWRGAVGVFDRSSGRKIAPNQVFRLASNTKTYVAAAILRLLEEGKLGLDDPIQRHIAPGSVAELLRGGYDPRIITVRELLHHTSGLFDYSKSPDYAKAVLADPAHRWTRAEQLAFAVDHGRPYGRPGERYHYSDTGYILLGEILERATSLSLGAAVLTLLELDRLGIRYTWFETLDSVPPGAPALAHQYLDSLDLSRFDPSPDLYGGGGLVSNADELARFYRALVRGQVLRRAETLDLMLTPSSRSLEQQPDAGYGMGIGRGGLNSVTCYGHSGFLGTVARTCPAIDLTVAGSMNRSPDSAFTVARVAAAAMALVLPAIEKARADSSR